MKQEITPTEIANFLINLAPDLREYLIGIKDSHIMLRHIMEVFPDKQRRVEEIKIHRDRNDEEFYIRLISVPDEEFVSFLKSSC